MHQIEINVIGTQGLQRAVNAVLDSVMPCIVELGGEPYLRARNARCLDTGSDFGLVAVGKSSVDMAISFPESDLDGLLDFVRLRLPCSES